MNAILNQLKVLCEQELHSNIIKVVRIFIFTHKFCKFINNFSVI